MLMLDNKALRQIRHLVNKTWHVPLFAVNRDGGVVMCNGIFLLDIPKEYVKDCPQLQKLYSMKDHKKASNIHAQIERYGENWADHIFDGKTRFSRASETVTTPLDRELCGDGVMTFEGPKVHACYNLLLMEAVELVVSDAKFKLHKNKVTDHFTLAVFDDKYLAGAVMNLRPH